MTIRELFHYAQERDLADKDINIIGYTDCGMAGVSDTCFFLKADDRYVNLIITEEQGDYLPSEYSDAVPMWGPVNTMQEDE